MSGCRPNTETADAPPPNAPQTENVSADPWKFVASTPYGHHGGYLGNGLLGMRFGPSGSTSSPDGKAPAFAEMNKGRDLLCVVSGMYSNEHLVPAPNWGQFAFLDGDRPLYPERGEVESYRQTLDLQHGELITAYTVERGRPAFTVELTSRVHRDQPNLVTLSARITPQGDGVIRISAPFPQADPEIYEAVPGSSFPNEATWKLKGGAPPANVFLSVAQEMQALDAAGRAVAEEPEQPEGVKAYRVAAQQPITVTKWVYVSASSEEERERPLARLQAIQQRGLNALAESHRRAWGKLWESDVRIEGDLEAQHAVRSALFYLLSSVREGASWSIPPMGLSGVQWGGHIFWDADTWMFPVLGLLHPDLANAIVDYRSHTLDGAKWNAKQNGYEGADYATESAVTGREIAPAEFPFHDQTSADVAIAQWRHFLLTGDRRRLERVAYPILREAATYYRSRAVYNKAEDRYEIKQVISPDETAGFVDNDVYTNAAAKLALEYAVEASRLLGKPAPPEWKTIAEKLWLPFDEENNRYLEHEGYVKTRRKPKQADAQLLFFPLDLPAPYNVKANTLTFYAEHTSPIGPAMTSSVHAVIAAQLAAEAPQSTAANADPADTANRAEPNGETDWTGRALSYFRESYRPFIRPPFYDFSEKRTMNNTTFLTGCAGVVMGPLYGFGGIHYDNDGIRAESVLPEGWRRLRITGIHYRGGVYVLEVLPGQPGRLTRRGADPS